MRTFALSRRKRGRLRAAALFALLLGAALAASSARPDAPMAEAAAAELGAYVKQVCESAPSTVTPAFCSMKTTVVRLVGPGGAAVEVEALLAESLAQRAAGYQFIHRDVIARTAILFVFEGATRGAFHMCNVTAPLDIAWFRANGTILDSLTMQPGGIGDPSRCTRLYEPRRFGTYQFALELPQGGLERLGIEDIDAWRLDVTPWQ